MSMQASAEYNVNPRFVPDNLSITFGNSKDSGIVYDAAADELTLQTKNSGGTPTDRIRVQANIAAPKAFFDLPVTVTGAIEHTSYIEGIEITDPAAPASNKGRLYFRDNGGGKTQLAVRFPTGAVQVLATEP
jgi:hypothetical protein